MFRISFLSLLISIPSQSWAGGFLDLRIKAEPVSVCDGSLRALLDEAKTSSPLGYMTPREFRLSLTAKGQSIENYLLRYRKEIPTGILSSVHPIVIIAKLKELPDVRLALTGEQIVLNALTLRASQAIEGNYFYTDDEMLKATMLLTVGGHDLQRHELIAFKDLIRPHTRSMNALLPFGAEDRALLKIEKEFWTRWMVPELENDSSFQVFLSSGANSKALEIMGHEALHAQFFSDLVFREAVMHFWLNEVSEEDKRAIISNLLPAYGNIAGDPVLAANEFMAYSNQPNAVVYLRELPDVPNPVTQGLRRMTPLVEKYLPVYMEYFKRLGIQPVQVKF